MPKPSRENRERMKRHRLIAPCGKTVYITGYLEETGRAATNSWFIMTNSGALRLKKAGINIDGVFLNPKDESEILLLPI